MLEFDTIAKASLTMEKGMYKNRYTYYAYTAHYRYETIPCTYTFDLFQEYYSVKDTIKVFFNKKNPCDAELYSNREQISSYNTLVTANIAYVLLGMIL